MPVPETLNDLRFWASAVLPNFATALNSLTLDRPVKEFWLHPEDYAALQRVLLTKCTTTQDPWAGIPVRAVFGVSKGSFLLVYENETKLWTTNGVVPDWFDLHDMVKAALRQIAADLQEKIQREPSPQELLEAILAIVGTSTSAASSAPEVTKTLWEHLDEDDSV